MRVLLIDVNCKGSSTGKIVYDLYTHINQNGDEAAVCYGRGAKVVEENIFKFGLDWETYFHALLTRLTGYTGCFSYFSTVRLVRFIDNFRPDVVHIHELHAYFVNIKPLLKYLREKHIKTVMTLHCEFAYTGKCGHSVECKQWKTECKKCPHLHDYISTMFFDHTQYMFRQKKKLFEDFKELTIVTPSQWLADRVKQSFLQKHDVHVVHNGIDTDIFYPRNPDALRKKHGILPDEKVVLALAPNLISEIKGGQYVLRLAEQMKGEKIRFVLVGIDGQAEEHIDNNVLLGRIDGQELLAKYYSMADLFLICSKRESFPTTCLESLCCGTQIVGFIAGGTVETAQYPYGEFVEYGNTPALAGLVAKNLSEPLSKEDVAAYGRAKYSVETMFEKYHKKYSE